ncbi:low density lipoprotein receptor adapter protein 1-like isoform X2 [Ostrea edulis]|uniref:low density lipoprotein receptor adapter protein 1-like isoform X2 n=1 Tax=Ostrea edulis TaxID=37623 RepID=UPI002095C39B|nr:low density lipoprotein receptor adapter protein 1-like isoform X2 [Ostrea edulis]
MEKLRKAMRRSPNTTKESRHEKLGEGWNENKEAVKDGITFYMKYLGSTLVEEAEDSQSYGDGVITKALQSIIAMAKSSGKKLRKVALTTSPKGIQINDMANKQLIDEISIYRISFCSADKNFDKVFAFMARNSVNETMECHAYLCAKPKIAQAVTLTVSKAFELATDLHKEKDCNASLKKDPIGGVEETETRTNNVKNSANKLSAGNQPIPKLSSPKANQEILSSKSQSGIKWQSFEDENLDEDDCFSMLAVGRSKGLQEFRTDLLQEDVDESVAQYMNSNKCLEEFSRTSSVEDLLCL